MQHYGYYANKMVEEKKRVMDKNYRTLRKHFITTAGSFADITLDVNLKAYTM